jgi:methyl-accepting chemotaxis protein
MIHKDSVQKGENTNISFFQSLNGKLMVNFLLIAIIPLLTLSIISTLESQNSLQNSISDELSGKAELTRIFADEWINQRVVDMETLSNVNRIASMDPKQASEALLEYHNQWGIFETSFILAPDGHSIASSDGVDYQLGDREYFKIAISGKKNISNPLVSRATGNINFVVAVPIFDGSGKIVGVAGASIPTTTLAEILSSAQVGNTGEAYMIAELGGEIKAISPSRFEDQLIEEGLIETQAALELTVDTTASRAVLAGNSDVDEYQNYRDVQVLGAYTPLKSINWGILIEQDIDEAFQAVNKQILTSIILIAIAIVIIVIIAFILANSISKPLKVMAYGMDKLGLGEVNDDIDINIKKKIMERKDELGLLGKGIKNTEEYFIEMSEISNEIAKGNLTVNVTPHSEKDVFGNSFVHMISNLRDQIGQLARASENLGNSSTELAVISNQAGQATSQIAATIQQVASGTTQQSQSVSLTASSVEQMTRTIQGVASGAQDQAQAAAKASVSTGQLSGSIQQVTGNAKAVTEQAQKAAQAAQDGQIKVEETIRGMQSIRSSVEQSSVAIEEMGKRSDQIGMIVETIQDIASQTNLLALNAAIEAARAGEHGKGFAVVADEVRKLAERSASATQEISTLITSIQNTVNEAVSAMQSSAQQVENGVNQANQSGFALSTILETIETVTQQAQQAAQAAETMNYASNELVSAVDSVSAVIEENTAATEEMTASSFEVSQAIENIASISEENSAAVEEVSASAEEMSAQVQEVSASAQALASLAEELRNIANQFKL